MKGQLSNPFTESRVSLPSCGQSLLSYGDDSFSLFKRLNSSRLSRSEVRVTDRQVEKTLLERVEKQIYTIDETGHCLAQLAMDERLTQAEDPPDFWTELRSQLSPRNQPHPKPTPHHPAPSPFLKSPTPATSLKTQRQLLRAKLSKLQKIVKSREAETVIREQVKPKQSVIGMYQQKRKEEAATLQRQKEEIERQREQIEERERWLMEMELERMRLNSEEQQRAKMKTVTIVKKLPPERIIVRGVEYSYLPI